MVCTLALDHVLYVSEHLSCVAVCFIYVVFPVSMKLDRGFERTIARVCWTPRLRLSHSV
jgi:hypothetical protein